MSYSTCSKHGFLFGCPCLPRTNLAPNPEPKLRTFAAMAGKGIVGVLSWSSGFKHNRVELLNRESQAQQ